MIKVTSREFQKEFGRFRAIAHREAVTITNHGREDLVLISAEEYKDRARNNFRFSPPIHPAWRRCENLT